MRSLRHDLLKSALAYYERFARERQGDPRLRQQLAKAYFRVGQITGEIGSMPRAIEALRAAQAIWEPLASANPANHELARQLAACELALGKFQSLSTDYLAAMSPLNQSRAILERLAALYPADANYHSSLADCYIEIGIVYARLEHPEECLAIDEKARTIQRELIERFPDNVLYRKGLAENSNAIGFAHYKQLDYDAAMRAFREAEDTCQSIMKQQAGGRKPAWLLNLLALSVYNIGSLLKEQGHLESGLPAMKQSLGYRLALAEQHPSVTRFQARVAVSHREIGEVELALHENVSALQSFQKSVALYEQLVRMQPDNASFRIELALSLNWLGVVLDESRRNLEAIPVFEHAVKELEDAIAKGKAADVYKVDLCLFLDNLGEQYIDLGRLTDGLPYYERALQIARELSAHQPEKRDLALELVKRLVALGMIRRHQGEPVAARPLFAEAKPVIDRFLGPSPGDVVLRTWLAVVLDNEANTFADLGQLERARPLLEQAAALFRHEPDRRATGAAIALRAKPVMKSSGISPACCEPSRCPQKRAGRKQSETSF